MTGPIDRAIAHALPPYAHDKAARRLLLYAGKDGPVIQFTPEEEADLAKAEADRGEFAMDEEEQAIFAEYKE